MSGQTKIYIADNEELMKEWDYEANDGLNPKEITIGSHKKVWWKCHNCSYRWLQAVMDRTRKRSPAHCPCCTSRVVVKGINDLATKNPEVAKDWHPTKNGNLTPNMVTVQSDKLVWWHCPKCGKAWQAKVRSKRGCPHCLHRPTKGTNDLATLRPEIAQEWHPTKNENLTSQDVKVYSNKKVWWKCPNNHEYQARIGERTRKNGTNCPQCYKVNQTSFPEQVIYFYIKKLFPNAINRYKAPFLGQMELDIYIPEYSIGIEYDGEVWHKQEKESREIKKYKICKDNGIYLIRFKEGEKRDYSKVADTCYFIPNFSQNMELFERFINYLLQMLDFSIEKILNSHIFTKSYDINIKRDELKIREQYQTQIKDSIAELYPEIAQEWHPTKNGLLTPYDCKAGSAYKVWWKCSKCGYEWKTSISKRTISEHGCLNCSKQAPLRGVNDLATLYSDIAKEWHPTKNGELLPDDIRPKSNKKYWWKCSVCNFEWQASANNRIGHQSGCPACAGRCARLGINDIFTINPELQKEWDYEANKDLDPKTLPQSSHTKVWWKCKQCNHKWQAEIRQRIKGSKCPYCHNIKVHQLKLF